MHLFPAFLKLAGRHVVVVGGGGVATSKLRALVDAGAEITLVAPKVSAAIERVGVTIRQRPFEPRDLDDAWLVVAAATPEVNRQVATAAENRKIFVNAADDPPNASFYLGGVLRRAGLTVAISTDGRAPALAGLLREGLDAVLPPDHLDRWVAEAKRVRRQWHADGVPMPERRPQLLEALVRLYARDRTYPPGDERDGAA